MRQEEYNLPASAFHLQIFELPVRSVKESVEWYTSMFGLGFCFPYQEGDDEAWLNVNGLGFGLIRSDEMPKLEFTSAQGVKKPCITFQADNIQELREEMIRKGAHVEEMVYKQGGGYSFQFVDPNGHRLGIWGGWPKKEE